MVSQTAPPWILQLYISERFVTQTKPKCKSKTAVYNVFYSALSNTVIKHL